VTLIRQLVRATLKDAGVQRDELLAACAGCTGGIDVRTGEILYTGAFPGMSDINLRKLMASTLGEDVLVDNDCNLGALAEMWLNESEVAGVRDFVFVEIGEVGVGAGLIINGELYGRATDVDWCMVFPSGGPACRHPSQLYEAGLEGVFLFTLIWIVNKTTPPPGTLFWTFITGYGVCRMIVEYVREPDAHLGFILGSFSMGQLLSLPMVVVGIVMLAIGYQRRALIQAKS